MPTALRDPLVQLTLTRLAKRKDTEAVMHGTHYWVVGGEFRSLNFHQLVHGTAQVEGPFPTRKEAENAWRSLSEKNRHRCNVRFSIVEEPRKAMV
jgi:hypothetical protein